MDHQGVIIGSSGVIIGIIGIIVIIGSHHRESQDIINLFVFLLLDLNCNYDKFGVINFDYDNNNI